MIGALMQLPPGDIRDVVCQSIDAQSQDSGPNPTDIGALHGECDDGDAEEYFGAIGKKVAGVLGLRRAWPRLEGMPDNHPVLPWIVDYVAVLPNRCDVSRDGCSAYRQLRGIMHGQGHLLGRESDVRPKFSPDRMAKLTSLWEEGVYLGMRVASGDIIGGTAFGVWTTRTVQRWPQSERWTVSATGLVGGVGGDRGRRWPEHQGAAGRAHARGGSRAHGGFGRCRIA